MLLPNSEPAWAAVLEEGGWWVDAGGRQELSAASPPLCGITNEGRDARELGVSGDVGPLAPRAASGALCGAPGQEGPGGFVVLLGLQAPFGVGQEEHWGVFRCGRLQDREECVSVYGSEDAVL